MEPISLLVIAALALLSGSAAGAVSIAYLTLPEVRAWFQARRATLLSPNAVAATVVDLLVSGRYQTVQGVFDTRSRTWTEYRTIEGQLSPELLALHRNKRVVYHIL